MDNLTHALLGAGLITSINPPVQQRRGIWLAVMLGSQIPDLDLLPSLFSPQAQVVWHRGYSHSLVGLSVIAGLVTLAVGVFEPRLPRKQALLWVCAALLIHIGFDALTSYGTKVLYPFVDKPVALDVLYGVDLVILTILGVSSILYYLGKRKALAVGMLLVSLYIGARWLIHANLVEKAVSLKAPTAQFSVLPSLNPAAAWVLIMDKGESYTVAEIGLFQPIRVVAEFPKNLKHPLVERVRHNPTVDSYLAAARYPIADITSLDNGWKLKFVDLRLWPHLTFNAVIGLDRQEKITNIKVGPKN